MFMRVYRFVSRERVVQCFYFTRVDLFKVNTRRFSHEIGNFPIILAQEYKCGTVAPLYVGYKLLFYFV